MAKPTILAALLLSTAAVSGCASRYSLQASEPAMAADAEVVVKKNKTGTYDVTIEMVHLPPAERLGDFNNYAVWIMAKDTAPVKAGLLDYDERNRSAELEFSSPHQKFDVMVTLEKDPASTQPGRDAIIEQAVKGRG